MEKEHLVKADGTEEEGASKEPLFKPLTAEVTETEAVDIESYCVNCGENGTTKLLLTKIPYYKDIVIMSFSCPHCGSSNNEVRDTEPIRVKGVRYTLKVQSQKDLNRQVVKSEYTAIKIPDLDFEVPALSQKAEITTVEGILDRAVEGLQQDQSKRRLEHPELALQIDLFIVKLKNLKLLEDQFVIIIEDISGNCFVENPNMPRADQNCKVSNFVRSKEEDKLLGMQYPTEASSSGTLPESDAFKLEDLEGEVLQFPTNCPSCGAPCETNMKVTKIPYFKEVIIMATNCEYCGNRTNEVKSGTGVSSKGIHIEVTVSSPEDLSRDILKSETCSIEIPELELEVGPNSLGGKFTTIEGLLSSMKDQLTCSSEAMDSLLPNVGKEMDAFIKKLDRAIQGEMKFKLILDDPAGNSYVQSLMAPEPDEALKIEQYERSFEQNDDLGLNDMKTENYETT